MLKPAQWRIVTILLIGGVIVAASPAFAESSEMEASGALTKLTRGAINLATGWVEVFKRIHETSLESGSAAGLTWGLLRGIGYGFIRTAAGAYELVTFPFPAPPGYKTVIQPEYVFSEDAFYGDDPE